MPCRTIAYTQFSLGECFIKHVKNLKNRMSRLKKKTEYRIHKLFVISEFGAKIKMALTHKEHTTFVHSKRRYFMGRTLFYNWPVSLTYINFMVTTVNDNGDPKWNDKLLLIPFRTSLT